ncbi:MAG: hypothetical protein JMN24_14610 [gamma proteobacterium endosymbiont of Lamellibrachia anaximandri]|nr:hypothetical protein [gamma proteobacterium endosymbiont of Lamellibrachia anaximandri]MBL3618816.1 hypothetical protein [gamma proteobacterium endosymbiont of Lamellibrachia anaximandri]
MNLWHSQIYSADPHAGSGGTDELQTDVMRFMAILGFCLMAIFALVQSLPQAASEEPKVVEEKTDNSRLELEQLTLIASLEQLNADLEQQQQKQRRITDEQKVLTTQSQQKQRQLSALNLKIKQRQKDLSALDQQLKKKPQTVTPVEAQETNATKDEEPGFELRFSSNLALKHLVQNESIKLYALGPETTWKLTFSNGKNVFHVSPSPRRYHEMMPETVPGDVLQAFRQRPVTSAGTQVVWGVELPHLLQGKIQHLMQESSGGLLIIDALGRVKLERRQGNV